ncbi:hypothetical protein [uncultured Streptococcus sp.]|uniref:hypothetical protein n=1 Tax=uncultured Streptococcus sp. TaxID=83427 RepID=UPI0025F41D02|nr:hypothetical protein [uncultured Streptococcus sp.]
MAEHNEQLDAVLKKIKTTSAALGEALTKEDWEEAFNNAMLLKDYVKDEALQDLTGRELSQYHIPDIETELKKYWYFNGEMRKAVGALRKKGQKFVDFAN